MSLANNTEKIRALIEGISALPDVGNGGGGLPVGISKLRTGTIIPLNDMLNEELYIEHGLGTTPNFFAFFSVSNDPFPDGEALFYEVALRTDIASGVAYAFHVTDAVIVNNGDASFTNVFEPTPEDFAAYPFCDDTYYTVYIIAPVLGGRTYRWVGGVIDDLNPQEV